MKKITVLLGLALILAACERAPLGVEESTPDGTLTIFASIPESVETSASISDAGSPAWQEGDAIALYDGSAFVTFTLSDVSTGAFTGPSGDYTGLAVFPASFAGNVSEGELTLNLPAEYSWQEGQSFAPMIAVSETDNFCFYPVSGLFKFTFTDIPADASSLHFSTGSKLNGAFNIGVPNPGTSVISRANASTDPEKVVKVNLPSGHPSTMSFYLPAPVYEAGYAGFSVSISGDDGVPAGEISSSKTWTLARGQMLRFKSTSCLDALPPKVYLIGGCLSPSWSWSDSNALTKGEGAIYTGTIEIVNTQGFKMYLNNDWSATWLSIDEANSTSSNLIVVGGEAYKAAHSVSDTQVYPSAFGYGTGSYDVTLNLATKRLTFEASSTGPEKLYLHGGCFSPSWDFSENLVLSRTSAGIYEGDVAIQNVADWNGFKIWTDQNWTFWYGASAESSHDDIIIVDGDAYCKATGATDAQILPLQYGYAPGTYHMVLNLNTMRLTLTATEPADPWLEKYYLCGGAFDEDWNWAFSESLVLQRQSLGVYTCTAYMYLDHDNRGFKIFGQADWGPVVYSADLSSGAEFRILEEDNEQFYPYRHGFTSGTYVITADFNQMRVFIAQP